MKKLRVKYSNLEKDVRALIRFALFLSILFYIYAIYYLWNQEIKDVLEVVMPFGALISAVLVAKVASRLLTHNKIVREEDEQRDIVRITHHLIIIVSDMRNRVGSTANMLRKGGYPLILLIENAAAIEKRYEVLLDREIYRFVSGETIELIGRMSGYVVGLAVFAKALAEIYRGKSGVMPAAESPAETKSIEALESLLKDLDKLEEQIRQLRNNLESV